MRTLFVLTLFVALGAFFIISNYNIHIGDSQEFQKFGMLYYNWVGSIFNNFKSITGYVVKFEWLPNATSELKELNKQGLPSKNK